MKATIPLIPFYFFSARIWGWEDSLLNFPDSLILVVFYIFKSHSPGKTTNSSDSGSMKMIENGTGMGKGKTGVTADRDKIEFRLFDSSSIFNITLREELFSLPK